MKFFKSLPLLLSLFLFHNISFSQCFQIESILVDACNNGIGSTADEGLNEMFRIKIGTAPLNTSNFSVTWPAQSWLGLVQNATTAAKVAQLNANITAAGGCGQILEPTGGVLPANATVIVVTSFNLDITLNSFSGLTSTIYMIFQNNPARLGGHFANYNTTPGARTLVVNFGGGCSDSVTYQRTNLINIYGASGGSETDNNGATVNFTPSGTASYVNNGCTAPVPPFTVEAGTTPLAVCPGQTISLGGTAQGQTAVLWTAPSGVFSNPVNLASNYTVPNTAVSGSTITLTLTATNVCGATISDTIILNVSGSTLSLNSPVGTDNQTICAGAAITPIQYIFGDGATSATVTGIPSGVTATTAGNIVTINGIPTTSFNYTITTVGGCGTVTLNGAVTLSSVATLALTSATATSNQSVCNGNSLTPIEYTFGGGATSATVTGLPTGITANTIGNVITISGTPSATFNYSINTVGGCGSATLNGVVTVTTPQALNLSCDTTNSTPNSLAFSFSNIGQTDYTYSYTIDGGTPITGTHVAPSNFTVTGLIPGQTVVFTLTANGVSCPTTPETVSCTTGCLNGTLALTSLPATNNQAVCSGTAITPIEYTFGGGATGSIVTGLPAGITASTLGNVITITGTAAADFNYTITTVDGCSPISLSGNVVITPNATLNLTSATGTDNQTFCAGASITPIEYTFGGGATSATVSGLPAGITATTSGNVITINGTPSGNFSYTITSVGGCGIITLNGTVVVNPNPTLVLTSAAGSNMQTVCGGNGIAPIQYTFGGGATNVTLTGLPVGVTASTSGNVVTISGIPTTNFTYSISTVGGCGSTITLNGSITTTTGITPVFTQEAPICSGIPVNITTTSTNGIVGTWQEIANTSTTVTYEFTPNPGQCATTTTMTIVVTPRPTVTITSPSTSYCAGSSTNITLSSTVPGTTFNWSAITSNLDTTLVFNGNGASIVQTLELVNDLNVGFVTYTVTPFANGCSGIPKDITIYVNPTPIMTASAVASAICSGDSALINFNSNVSGVTYTWTFSATGVTGASNGSGTEINQVLTSADVTTGGFVIYTITPSLNGCVGLPVTVQIDVNPRPEFFAAIPTTTICSGEQININLSASIAGTDFQWTVLSSNNVTGATSGSGIAIIETLEAPTVQGTVVYTVVPVLNGCYGAPINVTIIVNPLPHPMLEDGTLCIIEATGEVYQTYTLNTGLSAAGNTFSWFLDGVLIGSANEPSLVANQVGIYSVIVTNTTTTCESEEVFATVDFVYPANSFTTVVTDAFSNNATITVTVPDGTGTLLYQLDEGALQASNIFEGVTAGPHTITVVDTEGCTYLVQDVLVIDYPKFFTPNGDGYNDTWNIIGLNQENAKLFIFDRYGKLIKEINTAAGSSGWNGMYNDQQLPSTDYWFTLDYLENGATKQFKAHFSLIR